jgi:hypothetical protein
METAAVATAFLLLFVTTRGLEMRGKFMFSIFCAAFISIFSTLILVYLPPALLLFEWDKKICAIRRI